jgi:hypothetical protein
LGTFQYKSFDFQTTVAISGFPSRPLPLKREINLTLYQQRAQRVGKKASFDLFRRSPTIFSKTEPPINYLSGNGKHFFIRDKFEMKWQKRPRKRSEICCARGASGGAGHS